MIDHYSLYAGFLLGAMCGTAVTSWAVWWVLRKG